MNQAQAKTAVITGAAGGIGKELARRSNGATTLAPNPFSTTNNGFW
ncbi:hypothetical protein MHI24_15840 [Paenibacillus sp. FSL K6-1096]